MIEKLTVALLVTAALAGCAADDPYQRTKTGAAIGAVAGAIIGHQLDDDAGRYVGAAAGAALGGGVGYTLDRQHQELVRLAAHNRELGVEVERLRDGRIQVNIPSEVSFKFDSAYVQPGFRSTLYEIADILNHDQSSAITIIGHTDNTGSDGYNLDLSQRRADNVADYLVEQGVSPRRLYTRGLGEREPRASNRSERGRQRNRRVEMFIEARA